MEGLRANRYSEKIQQAKEMFIDLTDMEQVAVLHELIDDTPYKTKNYTKYLHKEYYIKHNKPQLLEKSIKKYKLEYDDCIIKDSDLINVIANRHTLRDYENRKMDYKTFCQIIHYSFGVKYYGLGAYNQKSYPFKYTNTQGGLNYLDLYIVVNNVESIEQGLYYYDFINDELCQLDKGNMRKLINDINFQNEFSVYSNFICFIVADMSRVVPKYYKRAYRFSHVDAGILTAYLQIIAEYNDVNSCVIAGYLEHKLEDCLMLSPDEYPVLSICFGYKPEEV
ncbi:MAG: SagB family peptide dehydrogenase [Bacillota bacterium]